MIDEFNALFISWKSIVMGRVRVEEIKHNGHNIKNVYFRKWGMKWGLFPHKWRLIVQNFNGLLDNYNTVRLGDVFDGLLDTTIRVYWFDFFTLEPYMQKLSVEGMLENENNRLQVDYFSNLHHENQNAILSSSVDAEIKKKVLDDIEFANRVSFRPAAKKEESGKK